MMAAPTISIVAELAGVSTATVSRALAEPHKVTAKTRERVMAAVSAVGFVPNAHARNFRRRTSKTVILLVRDISNPFYLDIYKGVEEAAFDAGYKVLMGDARDDDARIAHYLDMVRERHADGVILMVGRLPAATMARVEQLPPMVVALETFPGASFPTVRIDNVAAAREAVNHLLDLGHRRIAHVTGPMPDRLSEDRRAGYEAALSARGVALDPGLVVGGDFGLAAGREAVRALDSAGAVFTALFAASDQMAVGAIAELRARGRRTPDDVSVVGFDDIVLADSIEPPLTTIQQPRREIGRAAMALMISRFQNASAPNEDVTLETRLVIRRSTAACPPAW